MNTNKPSLHNGRCFWCGDDELYVHYHDVEWGKPVYDDTRLFEKICLEGFQSGLSWYTILKRREGFRKAFKQFDISTVSQFTASDVERLLQDDGIIRHRGKIEATIHNAQRAIELIQEFGSLNDYFGQFVPPESERPAVVMRETIPSATPTSTRLSKDLKKRGWKFVGPTTCYAFMQAMGLVNDHMEGCIYRHGHR
ncbi:DNA-3-methyladenine glycosylase I [Hydromonas duriensis]|uniref:DNA-3-methyladenine glycosylase I n=1 Tax=Hydromonas duriensis TaxID=1527608 RepID=A0A4V3DJQ4_9BURK|nr:DNA-3-methyladenine glycosylase I [Hydromonas duriensis]TDR31086.1 DNA-3-methyladenine glycosylase I [Hydromonas duriensis]